ncbi:hypothetical protein SAMN02910293_01129 [Streptococcus henryi]|uniref:Uncharacterized protein n=1 Tax=Streptococcus henryi TaxID=439219 RepID=A0A1G6BP19_9STRE|nr:hypothetical protein [Streptococcus henryi]SDB22360.1 hypothetical protein SAMN02910293_01129 [Streptococcus henryi]
MAESFDYVEFARDFESVNGRPPTSEELKEAQTLVGRYVHLSEKYSPLDELEEAQVGLYKPSFGDRLKAVFSFLGRGLFKAIFLIIQTPIYLTLFFFNYIKSAVAVMIMFFVTKMAMFVIVNAFMEHFNISRLSQASGLLGFVGKFVMTYDLQPNFWAYPAVDIIVIQLFIIIFALLLTFSKVEST